jgi:microcystin-dependent protein
MFFSAGVGSVCGFAGQVTPVSGDANNVWAGTPCASRNSQSVTPRSDIPLNHVESQGWMLCDGRALSASAYPELFAVLGYLYGGQGEQFRIPDYRGLFLRGTDAGSGMDPDAAQRITATGQNTDAGVGSFQCDALQTHTHAYQQATLATPSQSGSAAAMSAVTAQTDVPTAPAKTATETRPKNMAINYLIKYR